MKAYTVRLSESLEVINTIRLDAEKNLILGERRFVPTKGFEKIVTGCDIFRVGAYGSDEFPTGTIILIPEITPSERGLVLVVSDFVLEEAENVEIVLKDITGDEERVYLMIFYPRGLASFDKYQIAWNDRRLTVKVK
jgi:hypothetical protein